MIHETAIVDDGANVGTGTKIWHWTHVCTGARIGRDCVLGQNVFVAPDVVIGDGARIQNNVSVFAGVTLEDDVFCGPSAVFTNVRNPRAAVSRKDAFERTLVRRGATIGANATIRCGIELGPYCFVGAGSVVLDEVPGHRIVAGNPARPTGWACRCGQTLDLELCCPRCDQRYIESGPTLEALP